MLILYLILGHLIADYLLQPKSLVAWKHRSLWGVGAHMLVHLLVTMFLISLYTGQPGAALLLSAGIAVGHFLIDYAKIIHDRRHSRPRLAYWLDQLAHFLVILAGFYIAIKLAPLSYASRLILSTANLWDMLYFNPFLVGLDCLIIFSTLTIEYSFMPPHGHGRTIHFNKKHYKNMVKRLFFATLIYLGLFFSLVPGVAFNF